MTVRQTNVYADRSIPGAAISGVFGSQFAAPGTMLAVQPRPAEEVGMARVRPIMTDMKPRALESEELLLLAVLEQAVADLDHPCPAVRVDADAYVFSYDGDYGIFSFESVCAYFKLSPDAVRQALRMRQGRSGRRGRSRAADLRTAA